MNRRQLLYGFTAAIAAPAFLKAADQKQPRSYTFQPSGHIHLGPIIVASSRMNTNGRYYDLNVWRRIIASNRRSVYLKYEDEDGFLDSYVGLAAGAIVEPSNAEGFMVDAVLALTKHVEGPLYLVPYGLGSVDDKGNILTYEFRHWLLSDSSSFHAAERIMLSPL